MDLEGLITLLPGTLGFFGLCCGGINR